MRRSAGEAEEQRLREASAAAAAAADDAEKKAAEAEQRLRELEAKEQALQQRLRDAEASVPSSTSPARQRRPRGGVLIGRLEEQYGDRMGQEIYEEELRRATGDYHSPMDAYE